jgi:hypothetical protein
LNTTNALRQEWRCNSVSYFPDVDFGSQNIGTAWSLNQKVYV